MNIITPEQNTEEFKEDVDDLLNSYIGVDMDQMDGIFDDLMNVMINHNIILPREFVMIGRGILLIEEAGDKLDPHFNLTAELEKFAKDMIKSKFEPGNLVGGGFNYIVEIEHLLKDLPDRLNSTLDKLENGELELNMNHTGLDELKDQLSISLIVSALLVGSSIAILADKGPRVWDISAIGFFGFLISAILGVYIIIKFIRTENVVLSFIVLGAASAADFKINDGFTPQSDYYSLNEDEGLYLCTWDYDDELIQEAYLKNDTGYIIVQGDNNTYNTSYDSASNLQDVLSYLTRANIIVDHGVLEVAEVDGKKYVFMVYKNAGTSDDWKTCYDELMIFNENNNIEPLADAI